jgi:hypothetical protein
MVADNIGLDRIVPSDVRASAARRRQIDQGYSEIRPLLSSKRFGDLRQH